VSEFGFTGEWSIMGDIGGTAPEFFGWERWFLGWLTDSQVQCISTKGTASYVLTPIENVGAKIVAINIGNSINLFVESRRSIGYDSKIVKPGVLVYLVDTSLGSGYGIVKVLPINNNDGFKQRATLSVGESISYGSITVKYASSDANTDTIVVSNN
jgi:hypothetical protein